jgi:WhiB family redox-sensing transcriptional regulator
VTTDDDWKLRGICRGAPDPDAWFPVSERGTAARQQIAEAKAACLNCPVLVECRRYAFETRQQHGIWGATTAGEREALWAREAQARLQQPKPAPVAQPVEKPTPVRVDGRLMAAPPSLLGRQYQSRNPNERCEHALMSNGRAACSADRVLDVAEQRPVAELGAARRCRSKACLAVFTMADREHLAVSHG